MHSPKSISKFVALIVFIVFALNYGKQIEKVIDQKSTCLCSYDGFGYYMYLPYFAQNGNLMVKQEWAQEIQDKYCNNAPAYQIVQNNETNYKEVNIYHLGLAYLELPGFVVGHISAKILDYKTDGFSKPYYIAFLLNSLFFIGLGIYYFRKLMLLLFDEKSTSILLLLCFSGTNYWIIATMSTAMTHHYLFAMIGGFAYFFFKSIKGDHINKKSFIISCFFLGLCAVIRPTHVLLAILPGILLLQRLGWTKTFWKLFIWYPILTLIWNIPQIIYWKMTCDKWLVPNLHTEDLSLFDPYTWKFLFSYRKGWLLYTPLFLLLVPAFVHLFRTNKKFFYAFGLFTVITIWVISSWECWWYSDSLGQRPMIDYYPLLFIPIGLFLFGIRNRLAKIALSTFIVFCVILNLFQSYQMSVGIMDTSRMSKQQYWHIWGETDPLKISTTRLLINRADTLWPEQIAKNKIEDLHLYASDWLKKKRMNVEPNKDLSIEHLNFSDLKTDEVLVTVSFGFKANDTVNTATLELQAAGRYNCYSWESINLRAPKVDSIVRIKKSFNLPDVRHKKDYLQVFVRNQSNCSYEIVDFKISTIQLIRE